jgi:anti-sigma B factor antagonist
MLKITKEGNQHSVELQQTNRLNILFIDLVKPQLDELIEKPGNSVLFNLEGIRFIDSAAFSMLINITDRTKHYGSEFMLCNVNDDVYELIKLLELQEKFSFCTGENKKEYIQ